MQLENLIFENLINNEEYGRKAIPFLRKDYFNEYTDQIIFETIDDFVNKYNAFPTREAILIDIGNRTDLSDDQYRACQETVGQIPAYPDAPPQIQWLLDETETFCQNRAIFNAIQKSIQIMDGNEKNIGKGAIPQLLADALAVSFDTSIGHDFLDDFESRFEYYHEKTERIGFDLDFFNKITKGGFPRKTINCFLAGTGVGKSLFMCHMAAHNLMEGKKVLYITLEMSEEEISKRIDCNLLDISIAEIDTTIPKDVFLRKAQKLKEKTLGKLIVKEYPTGSANAANFRHLLNELKIKKNFIPDIIYVDYMNICASVRYKSVANANSYTIVKSIAEELRGLAIEANVPLVTATQSNRGGYDNSDVSLTDTSDSFGGPMTMDFMCALVSTEDLVKLNQVMVIQLKSRYNDVNLTKKFVLGIDKMKMRLYNVESSAQDDAWVDDTPAFDYSKSADSTKKFNRNKFDDWK